MKQVNRICAFILCFIIAFSSVSAIFAAGGTAPEEKFDNKLGRYTETFAGGRQFLSTVPYNGVVYDAVILDLPDAMGKQLRCDGNLVPFKDNEPIYKTGYYTLNIASTDVMSGEAVNTLFVFRIMGTPVAGRTYNSKFNCPEVVCMPSVESSADNNGMYVYSFPNYKRFYSSVPEDGSEVQQAMFSFPPNVGYELYKNGAPSSLGKSMTVTQPGAYSINVYAKNYGAAQDFAVVYKATLNFRVAAAEYDFSPESAAASVSSAVSSVSSAVSSGAESISSAISSGSSAVSSVSSAISSFGSSGGDSNVQKDDLSETYNDDAGIYKEEFSSGDAFYTNTANGDISGGNVYLDIPANMTVSMTKDGTAVGYVNKAYINEPGIYSLSITDTFGTKKYNAKYSFRIQPGAPASGNAEELEGIDTGFAEEFSIDGTPDERTEAGYSFDMTRNRFAYNLGEDVIYMNMPPGMFSNEGLEMELPDDVTAEAIDENGEEYPIEDGEINESGSYTVNLRNIGGVTAKFNFYLYNRAVNMTDDYTAPDGYLITAIEYDDYKGTYSAVNGSESEATTAVEDYASEDTDNGNTLDAPVEEVAEEETEATTEDPAMVQLAEEYKNGISTIDQLSLKASAGGISFLSLPIDGRYTITMEGQEGMPVLNTVITVDRTAPVVFFDGLDEKNVSTGNSFTINCYEDDVTLIVYKGKEAGEVLSETGGTFNISGVDKYTIVARDAALNETTYEVRIARHIGAAGIGTIVLFIVLLAAVVGFIVYNSKKFSVR